MHIHISTLINMNNMEEGIITPHSSHNNSMQEQKMKRSTSWCKPEKSVIPCLIELQNSLPEDGAKRGQGDYER